MSGIVIMTATDAIFAVLAAAMLIAMAVMSYAMKRVNRPEDTFGDRLTFKAYEPKAVLGGGGDGDDGGDGGGGD